MINHGKNILIYDIGHAAPNRVKVFHLIIRKVNGYIDEHNGNKYWTLIHTDEIKDALKKVQRGTEEIQGSY